MVLKYFEIGNDVEGNRNEYTRYICIPYTRKRSQFIKSYLARLNLLISGYQGWYVKCKFIRGPENIREYVEHLKCKVTKERDNNYDVREPITAKLYPVTQLLPHENNIKYNLACVFHDCFGEQFMGEDTVGVDVRKL